MKRDKPQENKEKITIFPKARKVGRSFNVQKLMITKQTTNKPIKKVLKKQAEALFKKRQYSRTYRIKLKEENPLKYKARLLITGLRWGKGGATKMMNLIGLYIGKPCSYCGKILTLENLSLDHKIPTPHFASKRGRVAISKLRETISKVELLWRHSEENLHIVCLVCNRTKSNLTDQQFTKLMRFLDSDPQMKEIVLAKMKMGNFIFKKN